MFATWNAFNDIFRAQVSGLYIRAGWSLPWGANLTPREELLKKLYETTTQIEDDDVFDSFTHEDLLDYLATHSPRALFVGYGGTDDWAHEGKYDLVLQAAHQDDSHIEELWNTMQAKPEYRDQVTFMITADHGRGSGLKQWRDHDKNVDGAENIWIAVIGPDTPAKGEMTNVPRLTQAKSRRPSQRCSARITTLLCRRPRSPFPWRNGPQVFRRHRPTSRAHAIRAAEIR